MATEGPKGWVYDKYVTPDDIGVENGQADAWFKLTKGESDNRSPAWSPDGSRIAFSSSTPGEDSEIFVMNADGSGRIQLTDNGSLDISPSWIQISPTASATCTANPAPDPSPTPGVSPALTITPRPTIAYGPRVRPTHTPIPVPTPTRILPTPTPVPTALDFYNKGEEYRKAGNWQAAITEYTRAIEGPGWTYPLQWNSYFYRAYSYGNLGESIGETGPHWFNYGNAVADYSVIRSSPPYTSQQIVKAIPDALAKVYFNRGWNKSKQNKGHIEDYGWSFTEGGGCEGGCPWPARLGNNRPYTGLSQVD